MPDDDGPPAVTPTRPLFEDFDLTDMSGNAQIRWINDNLGTRGVKSVELFFKTTADGKRLIGRVWKTSL